jgi:branched-chain amino acid transport system substrate-binding protein
MQPAGPEKCVGIISAGYLKEPSDPQWQDTPEYKEWLAWMKKYYPSGSPSDPLIVDGYGRAQAMTALLKASGDNLTRENIMKQAAGIHDLKLPMLLPGITVSTSPDDYEPIKQMQLEKFDGTTWQLFGEVLSGVGN